MVMAACVGGGLLAQDKSLTISEETGRDVTVEISMDTNENVQGFVVAVAFDTAKLVPTDVRAAGATVANNPELVVSEILPEGFTLGVVMDFNTPYDGQEIPAGTGLLIAEADLEASLILECGLFEDVPVTFQDELNEPPLSNMIVVDGLSIYESDGLVLNDGKVKVLGTCDTVRILPGIGEEGDTIVPVVVEVDNQQAVEGYVLCVEHEVNPDLSLASITTADTDAEDVDIEFEVTKLYPDGGTIGVVFDFDPPYDGQILEIGDQHSLAVFNYEHTPFECTGDPLTDSKTYNLQFRDGYFGTPALSNVLVEGGMSVAPTLEDDEGTVTFLCEEPAGIDFYLGGDIPPFPDDGCAEVDDIEIPCATGTTSDNAKVTFYYKSDLFPIQGISMAVCFGDGLQVVDLDGSGVGLVDESHLEGTLTEGINAEFVSFNADNGAGELIIGILVDSTPPIPINHMYPPTSCPEKVVHIFLDIPETAECDDCFDLTFCEGITGVCSYPIYNRAAVFNESLPARTHDGCICAGGSGYGEFVRADCNSDQWVDVADPAATMSYLFLGVYDPSCLDACDSNDDGMIDLADVCATLRFLFKGGEEPPAPGPYPPGGFDLTPDAYGIDLGCEAGDPCDD